MGLVLAERVIGGWPHGHTFSAPINVTVSLSREAEIVDVLYKADDDAPWVVLPHEDISQPDASECRVRRETLCYFALLKTNESSTPSSSTFHVGAGVVFSDPTVAPTPAPSAFACVAPEYLYHLTLTDGGAGLGDGAVGHLRGGHRRTRRREWHARDGRVRRRASLPP